MTYNETLEYIYRFAPMFQQVGSSAYKEGMENSFLIDKHLNHPHKQYKTIHVGGTNGKGSVSHLLASVLQEAGYKTGLYTSPHLLDFRERIKVDGEMIGKDFVVDFFASNQAFFESVKPSFFELTTGLAFIYFAEQKVDIAVIEVGLGGRLDCTNVITPALSVITNISFDHTQLLGSTLTAIAREKAGIIKPNVPVVIGEASGEVREVFEGEMQKMKGEKIIFAQDEKLILSSKLLPSGYWQFGTPDYPSLICELGGLAQEKNAATVLCSINILNTFTLHLSPSALTEAVQKGFKNVIKNTGLMGRWQVVGQHPKIVLDTGHNAAGIEYVVRQLEIEKYEHLHIVFGMVKDKDISAVLTLLPENAFYYFTQANIPRALDADILAEKATEFYLKGKIFSTVNEAFSAAKHHATEKDFIFVGGSTFVVAETLLLIDN